MTDEIKEAVEKWKKAKDEHDKLLLTVLDPNKTFCSEEEFKAILRAKKEEDKALMDYFTLYFKRLNWPQEKIENWQKLYGLMS